jgi:glycosyltransferase involved in cell wall biosynthesis
VIRLTHLITDLDTGGAEMMLYKLVSALDPRDFALEVVSLTDVGPVGERIRALGVPVRALGMRHGVPDPLAAARLVRWLRPRDMHAPHVLQTWMHHADLVGGLAARFAGRIAVAWGLRTSSLAPEVNKRGALWVARACAALSHAIPARIVCCSDSTLEVHARLGYAKRKMLTIPNGFDLQAFRPDPEARRAVRDELGIADGAPLVGLVGRFNPHKDPRTFVEAAARVHARSGATRFVLCGDGFDAGNTALAAWLDGNGLGACTHLLGRRQDVARITAAFDVAVNSSAGEGFPNVVGEAMACEVVCAVTDVGDSAFVVGDTGRVVPPRQPGPLAAAIEELLALPSGERARLGRAARDRIERKFALPQVAARYRALYQELAACAG